MLAIPERCWRKLRATRSALRMARAGPKRRITIASSWTLSPSLALASNCTRSSISSKARRAKERPQITPSCLQTTLPRQVMAGGMRASVVTSPAPRSSSRAARIRVSRCSGASGSVMGCRVVDNLYSSLFPHDVGRTPAVDARGKVTTVVHAPALLSVKRGLDDQLGRGAGEPAAPLRQPGHALSLPLPHRRDPRRGGGERGAGAADAAGRPHQLAQLLLGGEIGEPGFHRHVRQLGDAPRGPPREPVDGRPGGAP